MKGHSAGEQFERHDADAVQVPAVVNRVPGGVRAAPVGTTNQPQPVKGGSDDGIMYGSTGFQHALCGGTEPAQTLPALN